MNDLATRPLPLLFVARPLTRADWEGCRVFVCGGLQYGTLPDVLRYAAAHGGGHRGTVAWEVREAVAGFRGFREPLAN